MANEAVVGLVQQEEKHNRGQEDDFKCQKIAQEVVEKALDEAKAEYGLTYASWIVRVVKGSHSIWKESDFILITYVSVTRQDGPNEKDSKGKCDRKIVYCHSFGMFFELEAMKSVHAVEQSQLYLTVRREKEHDSDCIHNKSVVCQQG